MKFTIHTSFITIPSFIFCGNQMGYPTMTVMKKHRFQRDKRTHPETPRKKVRDATVKKPPPACSSTGFRCSVPEDSQLRIGFLHCHFGGLYGGYFTWWGIRWLDIQRQLHVNWQQEQLETFQFHVMVDSGTGKEIGTWTYPNMVPKGARWSLDTISSYP